MAAFWGWDDAFGLCEEESALEGVELLDVSGFHESVLEELADDDACSVVSESAGMDVGGHEVVAECVHREERCVACYVAEVVLEDSVGELRTAGWFGCYEACLLAFEDVVAHEGEGYASEVGAAAEASDDDVWVFACFLHLLFGFESDDCLVEGYVTEYGAEGVLAVGGVDGKFDGLGDGCAE